MFSAKIVSLVTMFAGALLLGITATPSLPYAGSIMLALAGLAMLAVGMVVAVIDHIEGGGR